MEAKQPIEKKVEGIVPHEATTEFRTGAVKLAIKFGFKDRMPRLPKSMWLTNDKPKVEQSTMDGYLLRMSNWYNKLHHRINEFVLHEEGKQNKLRKLYSVA